MKSILKMKGNYQIVNKVRESQKIKIPQNQFQNKKGINRVIKEKDLN